MRDSEISAAPAASLDDLRGSTPTVSACAPEKRLERKPISKKVRFEIFKRDSFTCQYCGSSAPDVTLQIEHIMAVANGGTNAITNLVTACTACNAGKSSVPLSDTTAVKKAKRQLDDLQERRNQLGLMAKWQSELLRLGAEEVSLLADHWEQASGGYQLTDAGPRSLTKLLKTFSFQEITRAMAEAAANYIFGQCSSGQTPDERREIAFSKLGGVCRIARLVDQPELKEIYYIRGILRNRFSCDRRFVPWQALDWIKRAIHAGAEIGALRQSAQQAYSYKHFTRHIEEFLCRKGS